MSVHSAGSNKDASRRKIFLFSVCLLFSFVFWVLYTLSKTYTYSVLARVKLIGLNGKAGTGTVITSTVKLRIEGDGWRLLNERARQLTLEATINSQTTREFVRLRPFIGTFNLQMPQGKKIIEITPDSIRYIFQKKYSRKVPLRYNYDITFRKQYYFQDTSGLPDSVLISGPSEKIKKISRWQSPTIAYRNVDQSLDTVVSLYDKRLPDVQPFPPSIRVALKVEQYTEKVLDLPIVPLHADGNQEIKLLPSVAKVFVLVPLSYYSSVRPELFGVQCDLNEWKNARRSKLALKCSAMPSYARKERIEPPYADFIISQR